MIKMLSFDMDGTLVDADFNDLVWLEEIPRMYAQKEGIDFQKGYGFVLKEYEKVGENDLRWYDMNYWLKHFGLNTTYREILQKYADKIKIYPEVKKTLEILKEEFPMVLITVMPREFLEVKLEKLDGYFLRTFSTISDFKSVKTAPVYREICRMLNIKENELLHIGDSWEGDYLIPTEAGIRALCLDRTGKREGNDIIRSLEEIRQTSHLL